MDGHLRWKKKNKKKKQEEKTKTKKQKKNLNLKIKLSWQNKVLDLNVKKKSCGFVVLYGGNWPENKATKS